VVRGVNVTFNGENDYVAEFERQVDKLIEEGLEDRQERIRRVKSLTEEYVREVGQFPDSFQLQRLANEILREDLEKEDEGN